MIIVTPMVNKPWELDTVLRATTNSRIVVMNSLNKKTSKKHYFLAISTHDKNWGVASTYEILAEMRNFDPKTFSDFNLGPEDNSSE